MLQHTQVTYSKESEIHSANVCVVCDRFIVEIQEMNWIKISEWVETEKILSVTSFQNHFKIEIPSELKEQYKREYYTSIDQLLLSKIAKKSNRGIYVVSHVNYL